MVKEKVQILVNPGSGKGNHETIVSDLLRAIGGKYCVGVEYSELKVESMGSGRGSKRSTFGDLAKRYAQCGVFRQIHIGGDGTIGQGLIGLLRSGVDPSLFRVAVFPRGTANDFAFGGLNIKDEEDALRAICDFFLYEQNNVLEVDTFTVEAGRESWVGLNSADAAFGAHLMDFMENTEEGRKLKRKRESYAYSFGVLPALKTFEARDIQVTVDNGVRERTYRSWRNFLSNVQNGPYAGSKMCLAPRARVDDSGLDFIVKGRSGRAGTMALLVQARLGWQKSYRGVDHFKGVRSARVKPLEEGNNLGNILTVDGELYETRAPIEQLTYQISKKVSFVVNK